VFALDPLLSGHIGWSELVIVLIKVVIAFAALLVAVMAMIWFERKIHADMTNRIGPNLAGPFGVFQTLADGIKFFFKEDLMPRKADRLVFRLAPYLSLVPAFLTFTVIPLGGRFDGGRGGQVKLPGFHKTTFLQVADPHIGILLVLAMSSIAVYGIMLAGWSSGSKYPLLGSVRATAQMVSYEAGLGLAVLAVLLRSGDLSTNAIVDSQSGWHWNVWMTLFVPFVVFLIAVTAEMNRPPFDLVEAEQELVGGFHTEYSSIRFALFFLSEFMNVVTMSAIIVTLFFGGPSGPSFGWSWLRAILPTVWFLAKLLVFLFLFVSFRATLPRFRYDQLMDLGWKVMIPLALGWFLLLVTVHVAKDHDWNPFATVGGLIVGLGFAGLLLRKAIRTSAARRIATEEGVVL
jgi:NADH-quinone oxidoreductase subunit H